MLNIQAIRAATPGCQHHIHFNNAGAALPTQGTVDIVKQYIDEEAIIGGYEMMEKYATELEQVYHAVAKMINAQRNEIALFQSATDAWVAAFNGIPFSPGDVVLCSEAEYGSNYLNLLRRQQDTGIDIQVVPSDEQGMLDIQALEELITPKVKLIAITHVPTNGGLVNPAAAIGKIAKANDCLYLLDACQSVGQMPIDVEEISCDFLAVTGRKYLRAPRGTGFLYCSARVMEQMNPGNLDLYSADWTSAVSYKLHEGAQRFETFENNKALRLGLGHAVEYYLGLGPQNCYDRIKKLATQLRDGIKQIPTFQCMDIGIEPCGIVTFKKGEEAMRPIKNYLFDQGIYTSVSFPMGALLDAERRNLKDLVRASVHYYNTAEEVDQLLNVLNDIK